MRKDMLCKSLVMGIVVLFVVMSITPISGVQIDKNIIFQSNRGNTLYVGGSGEGNYTKIQDAIDDAVDGDTVYVFDDSSPYQLNTWLTIEKSINLIGENRDTTVISGSIDIITGSADTAFLIFINEIDWVNISGFTIKNSERCGLSVYMANNINISDNIFIDNGDASLAFYISNYSYISNNICTSTKVDSVFKEGGIYLEVVSFTTIIGNILKNCFAGITIESYLTVHQGISDSNSISGNFFDNNMFGMQIKANNTLINRNTISNHASLSNLIMSALSLSGCNNIITCNNFINNIRNANNVQYTFSPPDISKDRNNKNVWDGNYWGKPRSLPKFIWGYLRYEREPPNPAEPYLLITIDWHPAKEPYDINLTQNYDIDDYSRTIDKPYLGRFPLLQKLIQQLGFGQ
jgi:hypothetical protein